jgi:hybrid cluster-associated redox disulfide protein
MISSKKKKISSQKKRSVTAKKIVGSMTIMDAMRSRPEVVEKLLNMGMGCCGCQFAMMETLEQGCAGHGLDVKKVLKELNS